MSLNIKNIIHLKSVYQEDLGELFTDIPYSDQRVV